EVDLRFPGLFESYLGLLEVLAGQRLLDAVVADRRGYDPLLLAVDRFLLAEIHLRGLADEVLGLLDVAHPWQLHDDSIDATALHDRLSNAVGVDAPLDNLCHAVDGRVCVAARGNLRRVGAVDQVRPALEIEPEPEALAV